ncbi:DUF222 domain-containing protein [Microbacterium sp. P05]|uniref:HNH endonuclease signature motif containing protein n=1 Tax=Microbacterium sp. P05 TaxID=3366948 RepID=UPI0037476435
MEHLLDTLRELREQVTDAVAAAFTDGVMRDASEAQIVAVMDAAAALLSPLEAVLVEAAGEVSERSDSPRPGERMTTRFGCRTVRELLERVTRMSGRRAGEFVTAGQAVSRSRAVTSGETLPARFPAMRDALGEGMVGVDGVAAVASVIDATLSVYAQREAADAELAASARGDGVQGAPPASADELRMQAQVWAMVLDADGAEPRDRRAARRRGLTFGVCREGLVSVRGMLLPEVAAQWQLLNDAILNHKLSGPNFVEDGADSSDPHDPDAGVECTADKRSPSQKNHDALGTILTVAARSGEVPTLGGGAPTLVVSATQEDLASGTGFAHIDGIDEPLPLRVARHVGCTGTIQRVVQDERGRILSIEVKDRIFAAHQRKAAALRDGNCIIPGCRVRASWCEMHHVIEAARGGPTHTDNGVMLCWHHHRTLDSNGWEVRMNHGVPEVRAPGWCEPYLRWRPATTSPIMQRRRHDDTG